MPGAFPAEAGCLDPAKRGRLGGDDAFIDAHHAVFQRLGHAHDPAHIAAVAVGGQAKLGVVGHCNRLLFGIEAEQWRDRAEGLFPRDAHPGRHAGQHRGLKEIAAQRMPGAAAEDAGPLRDGVRDMGLDLFEAGGVDQRALRDPRLVAVADLQPGHGRGQPFGEGVIDAGLHQKTIGADAGLARVAILGRHGPGHGRVQRRVFKYDKRGVAAQLHGHALHGIGRLPQENPARGRGAGKGELPHQRIGAEFAANFNAGFCRDDVQHPRGQGGLFGQGRERQGGQGGGLGRLDHHATAGRERGAGLARDHGNREIPGRDRRAYPDRLLEGQQALVRAMRRDHLATGPLALFGEPLDKGRAIGDLAERLGQRLAAFRRDDAGQRLPVQQDQIMPAAQYRAARLRRLRRPARQAPPGGGYGLFRVRPIHIRDLRDDAAISRVMHGITPPGAGRDPLPANEGAVFLKLQSHFWIIAEKYSRGKF